LLSSRQYVAIQHWKGYHNYRYADYLRVVLHGATGSTSIPGPNRQFTRRSIPSRALSA
jgi:hypothetical protein